LIKPLDKSGFIKALYQGTATFLIQWWIDNRAIDAVPHGHCILLGFL
jgi:hypothetical protein